MELRDEASRDLFHPGLSHIFELFIAIGILEPFANISESLIKMVLRLVLRL